MNANNWKPFALWPDDLLFFRDGKPSTVGEDHYLRSLFPPHPTTLYGAIRTRRLLDEKVPLQGLAQAWSSLRRELLSELGPWGGFGELELRGPWLVRDQPDCEPEILLPAPQDLAVISKLSKTKKSGPKSGSPTVTSVFRFLCEPKPPAKSCPGWSHSFGLWQIHEKLGSKWKPKAFQPGEEEPQPAVGWYLTSAGIASWSHGGLPKASHFVHHSELWLPEPRTGVGLRKKVRSHWDGRLFSFGYIRLAQHVALGFEVRHCGLEAGGALRLGGDGRMARLEGGPPLRLPTHTPKPGRPFCLSFATPTLSKTGALPPGFDASGAGTLPGPDNSPAQCRVLAAILKNPQLIGGWDLAKNCAKPLRRAIPAGTVYVLEPARTSQAPKPLGINLCDSNDTTLAQQGFGLVLTGADPREDS